MASYDEDIARQSGAPFSNIRERKTIRRVTEHWVQGQRYSEERRRRWSTYIWWGGLIGPGILAAIKFAESFLAKGS